MDITVNNQNNKSRCTNLITNIFKKIYITNIDILVFAEKIESTFLQKKAIIHFYKQNFNSEIYICLTILTVYIVHTIYIDLFSPRQKRT